MSPSQEDNIIQVTTIPGQWSDAYSKPYANKETRQRLIRLIEITGGANCGSTLSVPVIICVIAGMTGPGINTNFKTTNLEVGHLINFTGGPQLTTLNRGAGCCSAQMFRGHSILPDPA